ncbi:hypothetical protein DDI_3016 [Dickeya dianthicola RNS04.9]|nr:hypothetical protein DDI_3016 [Dickeya dianthicola RNS04.9]
MLPVCLKTKYHFIFCFGECLCFFGVHFVSFITMVIMVFINKK